MSTATEFLPIETTATPRDTEALAAHIREANETRTPIYPLGGCTALRYGLPPKRPGLGLELAGMNRIVDYPARDMTITVESGITMQALCDTMAAERQRLPIDIPQAGEATLGGALATNWSGPRRYGQGTLRDYVIGISAVDGRGIPFKAGGRVVKNVAGYDFCKLLTGSLGTLAVITQVTLKVKPHAESSGFLACDVPSYDQAESMLARLVHSQTTPVAIELLAGASWSDDPALGPLRRGSVARLVVGCEGTDVELAWMLEQLAAEWRDQGVTDITQVEPGAVAALWQRLTDFTTSVAAPLVFKANMVPSATTRFIQELFRTFPDADVQAHAGNGIVLARLSELTDSASRALVSTLQPAAQACGGNVEVLHFGEGLELTRQVIWGGVRSDFPLMLSVKQAFDPQDLLNPGRFIYAAT